MHLITKEKKMYKGSNKKFEVMVEGVSFVALLMIMGAALGINL